MGVGIQRERPRSREFHGEGRRGAEIAEALETSTATLGRSAALLRRRTNAAAHRHPARPIAERGSVGACAPGWTVR